MGSSLNLGPFWGPFYKGAVLYWGLKTKLDVENYPNSEAFTCSQKKVWGVSCSGFCYEDYQRGVL